MIRRLGFLAVLLLAVPLTACSGAANNGLDISVVPSQPILIPYGSGTTVGGYFTLTAPYFTLSSLNINWTGTGNLNIIGVLITTPNSTATAGATTGVTSSVNCGFGGDDILNMFPHNLNGNNEVIIKSGTPVASNPFGCGSVTIPTNPIPTSFDIQVQILVIGVTLDNNNNTTGRVQATANITVQ